MLWKFPLSMWVRSLPCAEKQQNRLDRKGKTEVFETALKGLSIPRLLIHFCLPLLMECRQIMLHVQSCCFTQFNDGSEVHFFFPVQVCPMQGDSENFTKFSLKWELFTRFNLLVLLDLLEMLKKPSLVKSIPERWK